ncbi:CSLREA domain-containing protein [Tahibacter harae]|uniref:CSLREA domain-containing protein n=1 Tax=Tahibacter harae TaxID=2963937 RepID=A0ABT1QX94_9GAMM|nr:CSLREA domain-containing protein [Tahibacter harae]MCQ4166912.1 CSLREA domain-containing protein [Tahibacter harae]
MRTFIPALALFSLLAASAPGWTATLQVTTTSDSVANDGACSLREAITAANNQAASGAAAGECGAGVPAPYDEILLPAGSFRLERTGAADDTNANGDLDVRRGGLHIVGAGADLSEIRGDRNERVFDIGAGLAAPAGPAVTLRGLTIRNGRADSGGGIRSAAGWPVQIDACTIANNSADTAGGIDAAGPLGLTLSTLHANSATAPTGPGGGGLRYTGTTPAQLRNVSFEANDSLTDAGAALFVGPAQLNNVTVAGNSSDSDFNDSGSGAVVAQGVVEISNTLLATNIDFSIVVGGSVSPDCVGGSSQLVSRGHNFIGNPGAGCLPTPQPGDQIGTPTQPLNPRLLPPGPNGGTTETQMPAADSPAVDAGAPAVSDYPCEATDQRGRPRPLGPRCDIGAVESDDRIFADGFELPL